VFEPSPIHGWVDPGIEAARAEFHHGQRYLLFPSACAGSEQLHILYSFSASFLFISAMASVNPTCKG